MSWLSLSCDENITGACLAAAVASLAHPSRRISIGAGWASRNAQVTRHVTIVDARYTKTCIETDTTIVWALSACIVSRIDITCVWTTSQTGIVGDVTNLWY
jgi:hypothetical protein